MGGCLSCAFAQEDKHVPKGTLGARELDEMDVLTQGSLRRAFGLFSRADSDRNGKLDASELARVFKLEDDMYLGRLVEIIDCDGNGTIDFREFVVGLAAFVLSGSFGRVRFAFRLFDLNNNGTFSKRELLTAIRAAESRHEATRDAREKRSANYWGDRANLDPLVRYKDLIDDLDTRPDELGYEEFTRIVTRHPRVFAPANQMWHALRQYADPAVKVVTHIRQSGNSRFFRGTVLESGRAEQIFAPHGSAPSSCDDGEKSMRWRTKRKEEEATAARRRKKTLGASAADREGDESGLQSDRSRFRRWLDDAASSVRRTAVVGLERVSSFGRTSQSQTPSWEADARLARSASEKSAEARLDEDFADIRRFAPTARPPPSEDEDAASDVTMQDIWEALRGVPNPVLPDVGDARFAATPSASSSIRHRLAAAAAAAPPPADYSSTLDVAALSKRRLAARRARDGETRLARARDARRERRAAWTDPGFRSQTSRVAGAATPQTDRDARFANDASARRQPRASRRDDDDDGDDASLAGGFLARVRRHAAAGPPSEAARLGL